MGWVNTHPICPKKQLINSTRCCELKKRLLKLLDINLKKNKRFKHVLLFAKSKTFWWKIRFFFLNLERYADSMAGVELKR